MRTKDQIVAAWEARKKSTAKTMSAATKLQQVYNGDYTTVLPELSRNESTSVANLIQNGIDGHAMRIASVIPNIDCPPDRTNRAGRRRAENKHRALLAWWYHNSIPRKMRRRARHLIGLATSPVLIRPAADGIPRWEIRDPLSTYPAATDPDDLLPPDCIFSYRRPYSWLRANYPDAFYSTSKRHPDPDDLYDILQYIDADDLVLICVGQTQPHQRETPTHAELARTVNRAHTPLVVVPGRITMDRLQGQFDQMVGMYEMQSELWALQLHAVKRGIFAETYAQYADPNSSDTFEPADPYLGEVGAIRGGQVVQFRTDPGFQTLPAIDRLERAQRLTGAVPAEMGGESASNIRTGRRGQQLMSSAVDFPVQEHQEILAASCEIENSLAVKIAKAYWGDTQRTLPLPRSRTPATYIPNETFADESQFVTYAYAGADTNGLVIEAGQRIGMGTLSKETFMTLDPLVPDPNAEHDRIVTEAIELAAISAIQAQAADPNGPYRPQDLALLSRYVVEEDLPLYEAIQRVQEAVQAEQQQATEGQLPPEQMQPGLVPAGAPGTPQAAIGGPAPAQENLMMLLGALRQNSRGAA